MNTLDLGKRRVIFFGVMAFVILACWFLVGSSIFLEMIVICSSLFIPLAVMIFYGAKNLDKFFQKKTRVILLALSITSFFSFTAVGTLMDKRVEPHEKGSHILNYLLFFIGLFILFLISDLIYYKIRRNRRENNGSDSM